MDVALGFKAHSGWAALVAVGADDDGFHLVERQRVDLVDTTWARAPYHAAETRKPAAADALVARGIANARRVAARAVADAVTRTRAAHHDVVACAVLLPAPMPAWSTAEILAVHFRMHKAEGVLFPDALCRGAEAAGVALVAIPEKGLAGHEAPVAALGRSAGPPWGKDQKLAATAALVALEARTRRRKR